MPLKPEHMGKAYGAIQSDLGRRALREGWGVALWEFIAEKGVWPDPAQQDQLRVHAAETEARKRRWPAFARKAHEGRAQFLERIANGLE